MASAAHGEGAAPRRAAAAGAAAEEDAQPQACALQRVWAHAVPSACHLAVAAGAAAVACKSGVLLLLDAETGALLRCACAAAPTYVEEQASCCCACATGLPQSPVVQVCPSFLMLRAQRRR